MLGRSEFAVRQGFAKGENACTTQRRRRTEGRFGSRRVGRPILSIDDYSGIGLSRMQEETTAWYRSTMLLSIDLESYGVP